MDNKLQKWAVVFLGPPGSGKDTQAEMLARELKLPELKTSEIIDRKLADAGDDSVLLREKEIKKSGGLNTAGLVEQWIGDEINKVVNNAEGFILNGAFRRIEEGQKMLEIITKYFSLNDIKFISITLSEEESVKRNSKRRVCQANGHPIWDTKENEGITVCPEDGSEIITRTDDTPETIKKRYQIYLSQTHPVIDFLSKNGYSVDTINGEQSIEDIHRDILNKLW